MEYLADGAPLYRERMLVRLAPPLSRSREVPEALYREAEVPWGAVEEGRGEVKEEERSQVELKIHEEVWLSRLKPIWRRCGVSCPSARRGTEWRGS